jgi:hypothetical protein
MTSNEACFMVYITEKIAERFFRRNSVEAYREMQRAGFWRFLADTYSTSHTLPTEYLLKDAVEWFKAKGALS